MTTQSNATLPALELPLMYIEQGRTLVQLYASVSDPAALERLRARIAESGGAVKSFYAYYQPEQSRYLALVTVDITGMPSTSGGLPERLKGIEGVEVIQHTSPGPSLAAAERNTLQVAATPMVVMAREVLGGVFKSFGEAAPGGTTYRTGIQMGKLAASGVPPLIERLEMSLTLDLLMQRVYDLQVFGWAEVQQINVTESLSGVLELTNTFESAPWNGTATGPTCDFIRGFTTGVFSFAYNRDFVSEETACQGKGDARCRITFRPA